MKRIAFLHHSTGKKIWDGERSTVFSKLFSKVSVRLSYKLRKAASVPKLFEVYNKDHYTNYSIKEFSFPKRSPYGWHNYPYDYYNIWVKNAGNDPFMEEPTLEVLTKEYDVIILKHCFPVSSIQVDLEQSEVNSDYKSIANYKLQYIALRDKLHEFKETKFILFTGAALIKSKTTEDEARRAQEFFRWVMNEWDVKEDNIFLWDLYNLQTEGGIYFKDEYAVSQNDPHPNEQFSDRISKLLFNRIIDVIETNGSKTSLTGEKKE